MRTRSSVVIVTIVASLGTMAFTEFPPEPAVQTETFRATAQSTGVVGGQTSLLISISRWSTDEEREELLRILAEEGDKALAEALQKQEETGFLRFPGGRTPFPTVRLRYAREFVNQGRRQIVLATDRPIGMLEAMRRRTRTYDYQLSLITLDLGEDNSGNGVMAVGVQMGLDEETGTLEIKNMGAQPVRLTNVRPSG